MKQSFIAGMLLLLMLGSSARALEAEGTSAYLAGQAARSVLHDQTELRLVPVRINPSYLLVDDGTDVPTPCSLVR